MATEDQPKHLPVDQDSKKEETASPSNLSNSEDTEELEKTDANDVESSLFVEAGKMIFMEKINESKSDALKEIGELQKRKLESDAKVLPVAKISKVEDISTTKVSKAANEELQESKVSFEKKVEKPVKDDDDLEGVHDAEKEMLELAGVAATATTRLMSETVLSTEVVNTDVVEDAPDTSILENLEGIASANPSGRVEIVVEQDAPVKSEQTIPAVQPEPQPASNTAEEVPQTNTATVAAPQGVNPAMMSNLLHTAAAVAAAQNVAAATVQVIPGQAAGTIQLVPASEVQRTQELMAAGLPPQNINQSAEEIAKITQPVFSYLVTSQGTLIAAHASDGSELISGAVNSGKGAKRSGIGRPRKSGKHKNIVKKSEPGLDVINRKWYYFTVPYFRDTLFLSKKFVQETRWNCN